jgi:predicted phage terminase large subunit-like protein
MSRGRARGHDLFGEHPLDLRREVMAEPEPQPDPLVNAEPLAPPPPPARTSDGAPIGMRAYSELVTPGWNWTWPHLRYIDDILDRVVSGELTRVIFQMPTRIGKTEKINIRFPAYLLELDPKAPIIVGGYNLPFAKRLSRKIRRVLRGRLDLAEDRNSAEDWETTDGGGVRAAGVGVGIAGLPAKYILLDDPTKSRADAFSETHRNAVWEWYTEDVYTRLEPDGAIILTMARRHEDDLVGRILASEDGPNWTVVRMPALAEEDPPDLLGRKPGEALCPDRFDEAAYKKMRVVMGEGSFNALQQQRPAPEDGLVFKKEWFRYYTTPAHPMIGVPTLPEKFTASLQSWDMNFKEKEDSDFVAGHAWRRKGADMYLMPHRIHKRLDFPATIKAVQDFSNHYADIIMKLVEDKANGPAVIAQLKTSLPGLIAVEPEGDKIARAHSVTALYEAGNVWLPHPAIAPWIKEYVQEHLAFPFGAHDDDVDAGVQALRRFAHQLLIEDRRRKFLQRQAQSPSASFFTGSV